MFEEVQNNEEVEIDEAEHEALYAGDNGASQNQYGAANGDDVGIQQIEEGADDFNDANNGNGLSGTGQNGQPKNNNYDKQIMDKFLREKSAVQLQNDDQRALGQGNQDNEEDDDEQEAMIDRKPAFFSVNNKKFSMGGQFAAEQDHFGMLVEQQEGASQQSDDEPFTMEHMKQLLSNEKMAPEVLPYQHDLIEYICARINQQDREIAAKMQMSASGHAISTD